MSGEDAKRWATVAGRLGQDVTDWVCSDGPESGSMGKLVPGLSAAELDMQSDMAEAVGVSIVRMAATCALWSVGDTDDRARMFTDANDRRVFFTVAALADCNADADGNPGDGESAAAWWAWFLAARGVLWAHVNPKDLEDCEDAPPAAVSAIAEEYPPGRWPVSDSGLFPDENEYFGIRRKWEAGMWTDKTGTVGIKMKPGGKLVGGKAAASAARLRPRETGRSEDAPAAPAPPTGLGAVLGFLARFWR